MSKINKCYFEKPEKYDRALIDSRVKCKCGHKINYPKDEEKIICSWCGNDVFKGKKTEFEYRMNQEMRRNNGK